MAKGKAKGSAWERELSRILTEWISGQKKELYFWRSLGSGAVATINLGNTAISGDIIPLKLEGAFFTDIFSLEAKNGYAGASFDTFLKSNKNEPLKKFWEQALRDSIQAKKLPLVIFKKKGMPNPWLGICNITFTKLEKYFNNIRYINLKWDDDLPNLYFMNLTDFLEKISPQVIKEEFNEVYSRT